MGTEGSKPVKKGGSKMPGSPRKKPGCMAPSEIRSPTAAVQPQFAQQRNKVMGTGSPKAPATSNPTRASLPALEPLRRPESYLSLSRTLNDSSSNAISEMLPRCDSVSFANPHTTTPMLRSYREHSIILQSPNSPVHGAFPRTSVAKPTSEGIAITGNLGSSSALALQSNDFISSISAAAHESSFGSNTSNTLHSKLMEIRGRPVGLENYGNTCYCNSVVQLLYYCTPLRLRVLEMYEMYHGSQRGESLSGTASTKAKKNAPGMEQSSLLFSLCSLFATMHAANNKTTVEGGGSKNGSLTKASSIQKTNKIGPKEFLTRLKAAHVEFRNNNQQDAHEFVMLVLNSIIDTERTMLSDEKTRAIIYDEKNKKGYTPMYTVGADGLEHVEGVDPSPTKKQSKHEKAHKRLSNISDIGKHTDSTSESAASGALSTPSDQTRNSVLGAHQGAIPSDYTGGGGRLNGTAADGTKAKTLAIDNAAADDALKTPIECIFGGEFATVTTCVECSTTTIRREDFIDLNLNIEPRTSLTRCMSHFSDTEFLGTNNKTHCQTCATATPVTVTIRLRRMPEYALLIHLKRFRYDEKKNAFVKRADHVVLPHEIQVEEYDITGLNDSNKGSVWSPNGRSSGDNSAKKRNSKKISKGDGSRGEEKSQAREVSGIEKRGAARFSLMGFVAHKGEGPNLGHYFSCIRYGQLWRKFDDETVTDITEREVQQFFGVPVSIDAAITSTAYIVMYERVL